MARLSIPLGPRDVVPWLLATVLLTAPACGSDHVSPGDGDAGVDGDAAMDADAGSDPTSSHETALLARRVAVPGGGARFAVLLEDRDGFAMTGDRSSEMQLSWTDDGQSAPVARRHTPPDPNSGHLLLLLVPDEDPQAHAGLLAELAELISRRPPGERIALYRWGARLDQLVGFTHDREHLASVLARVPAQVPGTSDALVPAEVALAEAAFQTREVGNDTDQGLRTALVVGRSLPHEALDIAANPLRTVPVLWAFDDLDAEDLETLGRGRAIAWPAYGGLAGALTEAEARIDDFRGAYYEFAVCGVPATGRTLELTAAWLQTGLTIPVPGSAPEDQAGSLSLACDAETLVDGVQPYPERIEFWFTPEELQVYQQRVAVESKDDFSLSIKAWDDGPAIAASAHLRGQGSLRCERRNYTIDLATSTPRHWLPGSATDEFYLLSMCQDDRYIRAHTVYQLYARIGAFPPAFRLVELHLQGQTRGVYMLMEKPREKLVADNARVRSVVRRGFRLGDTLADVKYSITTLQEAENIYFRLLDQLGWLSGPELDAALHDGLDGRTYLRLLAMNSLLQSGDYVDEMWLTSTEALLDNGSIGDRYSVMGWDPDDIFSACHYGGGYAFFDPYGLAYCAEAEIDAMLLGDPVTYAHYVDTLDELIAELDDAVFQQASAATGATLVDYLGRPGVAAAMIELLADNPAASEPAVAQSDVLDAIATLNAQFTQRRQLLLNRIAIYRAQNP